MSPILSNVLTASRLFDINPGKHPKKLDLDYLDLKKMNVCTKQTLKNLIARFLVEMENLIFVIHIES